MEYVVGPIIAAVLSIAFTEKRLRMKDNSHAASTEELKNKIEVVAQQCDAYDKELPTQLMRTLLPVAKEVSKLKQTVGI